MTRQFNADVRNSMQKKLKYLFEVEYKDGSVFQQNADDVSKTDPLRSAFFDVKIPEVKRFGLFDEENSYIVDLQDGHFEVNGKSFHMHDGEVKDFTLVYFRRVQQHKTNQVRDAEFIGEPTYSTDMSFHLGWWGVDPMGKRVQRVLVIDRMKFI